MTWAWAEAPRQNVTADVLARLVAPGLYPKRISPPVPAAPCRRRDAGAGVGGQRRAFRAHYRRRTGRDETASDAFDYARARQAAAEEAMRRRRVPDLPVRHRDRHRARRLPRRSPPPRRRPQSSKIRLRRMTYSQAAGFAATLPCGICPAELARRLPH